MFVSRNECQLSLDNFVLKASDSKENWTMRNVQNILSGRQMENKPFFAAVKCSHFENLPPSITKFNITSNTQGKNNVLDY